MTGRHGDLVKSILSMETFAVSWNSFALSPDARWLAATLQSHPRRSHGGKEILTSGFQAALEGSEVWRVKIEDGKSRNITPGWGTSWGPSWSPDGERYCVARPLSA